ncbi:RNA polymerase sigma-70 factor [Chitinophaga horti]|uniref:RNA polymerase sigma-70 factor n=1 Tax=Chitinophaga horti TaxID=2920382 RepID=A0ABY6J6B5_9BACT|nr:RNA polymerase sigma-70 factor [Chitinophaga horti]UYQ93824.1 RNA polymerase sigma-70 factor [Chitinophaga horti]
MPAELSYDEKALLLRVSEGDETAFNFLFGQHRNDVYLHALTYTKSPEFAEELVLDIFMKIWNGRSRLTEVDNFRGYLFILSRNQVISAMRKRLEQPVSDDALAFLETPGMRPDSHLEFKEVQSLLEKALATLSPQQRTAFHLSRTEGKTYEEIAEIMGISRRTVNFHMVAALNTLRQYFYRHAAPFALYLTAHFLSR